MDGQGVKVKIVRHIGAITLVAGILGLLPNLIAFIPIESSILSEFISPMVYAFNPTLYFNFPFSLMLTGWNDLTGMSYNYLSIIFFALTIYAYYIYQNSKGRKAKMIHFCFSVILIGQLISLAVFLITIITEPSILTHLNLILLLGVLMTALWAYISFCIVMHFLRYEVIVDRKSSHDLLDDYDNSIGEKASTKNLTPKNDRLIHHIVDLLLVITVCSSEVWHLGGLFFWELEYAVGMSIAFLLSMLIARFIYYPFFETVFGTTPGKILTGSIVRKEDGSRLKLMNAVNRTFIRMVPFEPLSFLGNSAGWHDKWTNTKVVKGQFKAKENLDGIDDVIDDF
ncbi:MAG: putative RDD family membrane protein YckC [Crocinitomix sp.]|jgi:uncharacterized RDD family membrane protein YckC